MQFLKTAGFLIIFKNLSFQSLFLIVLFKKLAWPWVPVDPAFWSRRQKDCLVLLSSRPAWAT
jgi:hypothetical protein